MINELDKLKRDVARLDSRNALIEEHAAIPLSNVQIQDQIKTMFATIQNLRTDVEEVKKKQKSKCWLCSLFGYK